MLMDCRAGEGQQKMRKWRRSSLEFTSKISGGNAAAVRTGLIQTLI